MEYVHTPVGEEVEFLAGSYHIEGEERVPYDGHDVLFLLGATSVITSCCGSANPFSFIKVIGLVKHWQNGRDAKGQPVSEVEPVRNEEAQVKIRDIVHKRHPDIDTLHIEFW
ncbi:MAG: hypothetical protein Q7T05_00025 [Dehalococcoidia bacterium]|nr:hypothetical protein [Dehalococcoidia bacterium]